MWNFDHAAARKLIGLIQFLGGIYCKMVANIIYAKKKMAISVNMSRIYSQV